MMPDTELSYLGVPIPPKTRHPRWHKPDAVEMAYRAAIALRIKALKKEAI